MAADLSLSFGDFRSGERTFQLLTQAAGRAGRGELAGEVVIQTYQPEHYSVQYAALQDFEGFYEQEMLYRELMQYPPAGRMMAIQFMGPEEAKVKALAEECNAYLNILVKNKNIQVLGATQAALAKLKDIYRYVIYVKASRLDALLEVKNELEEQKIKKHNGQEMVQFDFDPVNMF